MADNIVDVVRVRRFPELDCIDLRGNICRVRRKRLDDCCRASLHNIIFAAGIA